MSIKLKLPRTIQARSEPLTHDELKLVAPAAFSTCAGVNTLSQYRSIPTYEAIMLLEQEGYVPTFAAQARSQLPIYDREAKHVIRMRHESCFSPTPTVGDAVPELILVNSNDGSSKFIIYVGLYRFICTNGLMAGSTLETFELRHVGTTLREQVADMLIRVTRTALPLLTDQMHMMRHKQLSEREQATFASRAIALRWPEGTEAITTQALLRARRPEDAANDLWHTLNRVQENIIQGGFHAHNTARLVRPLEQVSSLVTVNRGLWDIAMRMAA